MSDFALFLFNGIADESQRAHLRPDLRLRGRLVHNERTGIDSTRENWATYFRALKDDRPFPTRLALLQTMLRQGVDVLLGVNAPSLVKQDVEDWLVRNGVNPILLRGLSFVFKHANPDRLPFQSFNPRDNKKDKPTRPDFVQVVADELTFRHQRGERLILAVGPTITKLPPLIRRLWPDSSIAMNTLGARRQPEEQDGPTGHICVGDGKPTLYGHQHLGLTPS
jgi:hypothetical protein